MARPLKLFRIVQKSYQMIGIFPRQPNQIYPLNSTNVLYLYTMVQFIIVSSVYFLFKAERLDEFGLSFYVTLTATSILFYYVTNIHQIGNILKLIEKFEEFIGNSECFDSRKKILNEVNYIGFVCINRIIQFSFIAFVQCT